MKQGKKSTKIIVLCLYKRVHKLHTYKNINHKNLQCHTFMTFCGINHGF